MRNLAELKPGQGGRINGFEDDPLSFKLMEMGCLPGELVSVINFAPLGGPISIKVSGYVLSLRKSEAALIRIDMEESPLH